MNRELSPLALGFAIAALWGAGVFLTGLISTISGWSDQAVTVLGSVYLGYSSSVAGSFIGTAWALVDGFVCGFVIAWLYNRFAGAGAAG
jgi:hypothetical protein